MRYSARVEYDGTDFAGFQVQPGRRTVQGELERALARSRQMAGAGRVDGGRTNRRRSARRRTGDRIHLLRAAGTATSSGRALQALLPADIGLGPLRRVAADFRPRYRARRREYRYQIWNGPPSPLRERYALGVREPLDAAAMARRGAGVRRPARLLRLRWQGSAADADVATGRGPQNGSAGHGRSWSETRSCARWSAASWPRCCASGTGEATAADVAAALAPPVRAGVRGRGRRRQGT